MTPPIFTLVNVSTAVPRGEGGEYESYLPLGCLYLVAALERAGVAVEFRDYQLHRRGSSAAPDVDSLVSCLDTPSPILGISCMVSMLPLVLLATKRWKELNPERIVVLGGPGPSGVAEAIVRSMPWIDVVARGEGEETVVELMSALAGGRDLGAVAGITYREGAEARRTPPRARLRDLDAVGLPAYSRVDVRAYDNVSIIGGRGCPYRCAFCDVGPLWENKTFFRSIESMVGEMRLLRDSYGHQLVHVADDTFDIRRERADRFCAEVSGLGVRWTCLARVDLLDETLLTEMSKAGCEAIFLGIESGSDAVLSQINKRFTIKEATEKTELAARHIQKVVTSFIWGFPFETMDDLKLTVFSVLSMGYLGARAGLKLLSPMPLSPLGIAYADRLRFDEDLCSMFASLGSKDAGGTGPGVRMPEEFAAIIREYPGIFAGFHHIHHEGLREKAAYVKRFSMKREHKTC